MSSNMCCCALLCVAMHCYALLCIAMRCYALLWIAMRCYVLLCVAMRCIAIHCYVLLCVARVAKVEPDSWISPSICLNVLKIKLKKDRLLKLQEYCSNAPPNIKDPPCVWYKNHKFGFGLEAYCWPQIESMKIISSSPFKCLGIATLPCNQFSSF